LSLDIDATTLLPETLAWLDSSQRYLVHKGGTRSSKTWSILQALIVHGLQHAGLKISIYRAEQTTAKRTVGEDLVEILRDQMGIYDADAHHKTDAEYTLPSGTVLRLRGCDKSSRLRGEKSNILYINEMQEIAEDSWTQLKLRSERVVLDFNPSFDFSSHYIAKDVLQAEGNYQVVESTYKDNPFLTPETVQGIESLIPRYREPGGKVIADPDLSYEGEGRLISGDPVDWSVYGRASYMRSPMLLLPRYTARPFQLQEHEIDAYGLDFGFTAPSALTAIAIDQQDYEDDHLYAEELLYEKGLTTSDLIARLDDLGISKKIPLYCDSAEPDRIVQLQRAGYDARKSRKDVSAGLDAVRSHQLQVSGANLEAELKSYMRKNKDSDEPRTGVADHLIDAIRYPTLTLLAGEPQENWGATYDALNGLTI